MGIDSTVGIATRYRLDGPGIESLVGGARFTASDQTAPGAHPASYTIGTAYFPGLKRPGRGIDHSPSSDEVKERVELYISAPPPLDLRGLYQGKHHLYVSIIRSMFSGR